MTGGYAAGYGYGTVGGNWNWGDGRNSGVVSVGGALANAVVTDEVPRGNPRIQAFAHHSLEKPTPSPHLD
jgi:hypothetical protein